MRPSPHFTTFRYRCCLQVEGDHYKKEFFLGRSTVKLPFDVFDEFVNYLRPSLGVVEHKVAKMSKEIDALPHKEKQWQCN